MNYSDPDMDALILSVDTEAMANDVPTKKSKTQAKVVKRPITLSSPEDSETEQHVAKRQKTPANSMFNDDTLNKSLFMPNPSSDANESLKGNSEGHEPFGMIADEDDYDDSFGLKSHLADITGGYASNLTSSSVTLNSSFAGEDNGSFHSGILQSGVKTTNDKSSLHSILQQESNQELEMVEPGGREVCAASNDDLEDFESWLRSGAVEIVD